MNLLAFLQIRYDKLIMKGIEELRHCHSQNRVQVRDLLDEERSHIKSIVNVIEEKIQQYDGNSKQCNCPRGEHLDESECRDVHISTDAKNSLVSKVCLLLTSTLTSFKSVI